jgi:asparagine synthase (glutamine-hydrolysing)
MRGLLPDAVLFRKKSPFPKTHDPHYLELVSNLLKEVIQDKQSPILQIVKPESLAVLLSTDFSWPWYGQLMQRPQIIAYMLQINLWLKHYSLHIV